MMDPNATLLKLRQLIAETERLREYTCTNAVELADAARDLDEWLTKGGALPKGWERAGEAYFLAQHSDE